MALTSEQKKKLIELHTIRENAQMAQPTAPQTQQSLQTEQPVQDNGFIEGAKNFGAGVIRGLGSAGRTVQDILPRSLGTLPTSQGAGLRASETPQPESAQSLPYKAGEFVGEVVPFVAQPAAGAAKGAIGLAGRGALDTAIGTAQTGDVKEGATIGIGGQAINVGGKALQAIGKGLYKAAIPLSTKEAVGVQAYQASKPFFSRVGDALKGEYKGPITNAETAFRNGLIGTESAVGVQATKAKKAIWEKSVKPALESVSAKVDLPEFFTNVEKNIIETTPELTRQKSLLNALKAIREDYEGTELISASKLQDLKSGWAEFVPEKAYKGENIAGALNDVRNKLAGQARTIIYDAVDDPNIKQAYIDYGNLTNLQKWGQKAMTGGKLKGGAGGFISALKDAVLVPVATVGGKTIYKTAQGIEFIGNAGAKTLNDIINSSEE